MQESPPAAGDSPLTESDHTVNELAAPDDVSLQAVPHYLKLLQEAGLVSRSREAQRRAVHLEAEVFDLMTQWIEPFPAWTPSSGE